MIINTMELRKKIKESIIKKCDAIECSEMSKKGIDQCLTNIEKEEIRLGRIILEIETLAEVFNAEKTEVK